MRGENDGAAPRRGYTSAAFKPIRSGFTLVEVLAATALALLMMGTVVSMFAIIGDNVGESRATVEMTERHRSAQLTLGRDLAGITGRPIAPSRDPENGDGFLEIIEGPIGPVMSSFERGLLPNGDASSAAVTDEGTEDTTVGDIDDVLMFTTRRSGDPFVGRADTRWAPSATIESQVAEVCWFLRGTTLYRRQLLVVPSLNRALAVALAPLKDKEVDTFLSDFYARNDLSVHMEGGPWDTRADKPPRATLVLNTLGDLTKREHRYGHQPFAFPHDARFWGRLGLPTLRDCCVGSNAGSYVWPFPFVPSGDFEVYEHHLPISGSAPQLKRTIIAPKDVMTWNLGGLGFPDREVWQVLFHTPGNQNNRIVPYPRNFWTDNDPSLSAILQNLNSPTYRKYTNDTTRVSDDVILTNVISFDVEVWDPGAPIYERPDEFGAYVSIVPGDVAYAAAVRDDMLDRDGSNRPKGNLGPVSFGAFVDLNYMAQIEKADIWPIVSPRKPHYRAPNLAQPAPEPSFHHAGERSSYFRSTRNPNSDQIGQPVDLAALKAAVFDTWSSHYEHDGLNQDAWDDSMIIDQGTNGLDDPSADPITGNVAYPYRNGADDMTEREVPPPYDAEVKAVRVKIRVFEPDSQQIREVTVVQDF
jgi:type II secretory pathway component PulJ